MSIFEILLMSRSVGCTAPGGAVFVHEKNAPKAGLASPNRTTNLAGPLLGCTEFELHEFELRAQGACGVAVVPRTDHLSEGKLGCLFAHTTGWDT